MANLIIGVKGTVVAMDRATGAKIWETPLKGGDFVNVMLDGGQLFAATKGEVFCLDPATGQVRWKNGLPGMGLGLISMAQAATGNLSAMEERLRREKAANATIINAG